MTPPARSSAAAPAQYADVHYADRPMRIEYALLAPERRDAPLLVFLHEGLGSLAMWRDWPRRVCDAAGCRGLVYSRYGYGRSTVRPLDESRPIDYLHQQAAQALPALFAALGIDARRDKPVLFGHSDGASIALLYAALCPDAVAGIAVAAPHIYVEDITVANIAVALRAYRETTLRDRLARYHDDVDSTFASWTDTWLDPAFRQWNIEAYLPAITCPVLAMQGVDDEYGTLEQIRGIRRLAPQTRLLEIQDCGHSPHKDQPELVTRALAGFVGGLPRPA
ncbi:alpha/beta hydrolase family protein [Bordetella bronchiseptica MBORD675]|uniref:alpha/beta fold hydrolase n=1 Tax=Bordetella bronchiseptica TaxID=518 RepID=UPI00028AA4A7|nr:alpha/beta hydrolase [Bordetella bronchiseptica]KCV35791.1 alpha/beta hydrolase family protein [Bordetella bronchiseptica 00-P-2730]AZW31338.1 alpha/beta hydrolase [Bordetella bronchiseptica]KCV39230.1 alpha/beta hydrolase family protein [Bordetella bronchiseptica 345]KDC33830.1 alpha/beta hydrolase family protein [Bordetella bronchiseptica GA96-01]KDC91318.1 alpha/beta hydrolase family protein [Bordetella bronchiseptica MBORD675]